MSAEGIGGAAPRHVDMPAEFAAVGQAGAKPEAAQASNIQPDVKISLASRFKQAAIDTKNQLKDDWHETSSFMKGLHIFASVCTLGLYGLISGGSHALDTFMDKLRQGPQQETAEGAGEMRRTSIPAKVAMENPESLEENPEVTY